MLRKTLFITAALSYALTLGCVFWPSTAPAGKSSSTDQPALAPTPLPATLNSTLPYRGAAIQLQRVDWIDDYKKAIDQIAAVGCDTVSLVVDARQENGSSSRIYLDMRMTPTPAQLADLIGHAKALHLRVVLMPIVLLDNPRNDEWRGKIQPDSWSEWFDSYRDMIHHYAWIAQSNHADVLVIGSELVSTETNLDEWTKTIQSTRKIFHGQLTYSSNWDHYTAIHFWDQLDLVGMNSYWKLGDDRHASVEDITKHSRDIQSDLIPFLRKTGKPLLFLEVGWCSLANAAHEPWDYTKTSEPEDLDLQRRLYEGFFKSWYGNPHLGGFMIWEWPPDQGGDDNRGYTPRGKPAESVLRHWLAQPRWPVK